jgi:cell wall-associated NlpC family hydrolase
MKPVNLQAGRAAGGLVRSAVASLALATLLLGGCAPFRPGLPAEPTASVDEAAGGAGAALARDARAQLGTPYLYGGTDPQRGFDCSGLVAWVHGRAGIVVPRTAAQQFAVAEPVPREELRPGDLVFFRLDRRSRAVTHVGVYSGQGRFVHAPQSGRVVEEARLDDPYFAERFAGAGRFRAAGEPGGAGSRTGSPRR